MKKLLIASLVVSSGAFAAVDGTGDPDSLSIKVYRFAVSSNGDCSNPQIVVDNSADPTYVSMLSSPNFGAGALANGDYPCVMIEMSDQLKFSPDGNVGTKCDGNTEYTLDVCGSNSAYTDLDGNAQTCAGDNGSEATGGRVDTKVVLYLSTFSTSTGGGANAFSPPTAASDASNGFNLGSQLVVQGTEVGVFNVNGTGKVESDTSRTYCEFQPPLFSFTKK